VMIRRGPAPEPPLPGDEDDEADKVVESEAIQQV